MKKFGDLQIMGIYNTIKRINVKKKTKIILIISVISQIYLCLMTTSFALVRCAEKLMLLKIKNTKKGTIHVNTVEKYKVKNTMQLIQKIRR